MTETLVPPETSDATSAPLLGHAHAAVGAEFLDPVHADRIGGPGGLGKRAGQVESQ